MKCERRYVGGRTKNLDDVICQPMAWYADHFLVHATVDEANIMWSNVKSYVHQQISGRVRKGKRKAAKCPDADRSQLLRLELQRQLAKFLTARAAHLNEIGDTEGASAALSAIQRSSEAGYGVGRNEAPPPPPARSERDQEAVRRMVDERRRSIANKRTQAFRRREGVGNLQRKCDAERLLDEFGYPSRVFREIVNRFMQQDAHDRISTTDMEQVSTDVDHRSTDIEQGEGGRSRALGDTGGRGGTKSARERWRSGREGGVGSAEGPADEGRAATSSVSRGLGSHMVSHTHTSGTTQPSWVDAWFGASTRASGEAGSIAQSTVAQAT